MNLLTDELSMTAADLDTARTAIVRSLKRGVEKALHGDFDQTHVIQFHLNGIWFAFTGHPLGPLAQRANVLIDAAKHHHLGTPYILTDTGRKLAGLNEGEAA